jgi:hypothetical protein
LDNRFATIWQQRWRSFAEQNRQIPCWWSNGTDNLQAALGSLSTIQTQSSGLIVLGFAPVGPAVADRVSALLIAAGIPVAMWARNVVEGDLETALRTAIFEAEAAACHDLRDRVLGVRNAAVAAAQASHLGRMLTLFWDDPERPPKPFDPGESEGQGP